MLTCSVQMASSENIQITTTSKLLCYIYAYPAFLLSHRHGYCSLLSPACQLISTCGNVVVADSSSARTRYGSKLLTKVVTNSNHISSTEPFSFHISHSTFHIPHSTVWLECSPNLVAGLQKIDFAPLNILLFLPCISMDLTLHRPVLFHFPVLTLTPNFWPFQLHPLPNHYNG